MQSVLVYPEAVEFCFQRIEKECNFQSIPCLDHLVITRKYYKSFHKRARE